MSLLAASCNAYQGIIVDASLLPHDLTEFDTLLRRSLEHWQAAGNKVVWLEIPDQLAALIPCAIAQGFSFHHCSAQQLTLTRRLQTDALIPDAATHSIGVGAVVISPRGEVLTVLETSDMLKRPGFFKLPGGMLERGEHIADGAMREVLEETGIQTSFIGMVALRHHHQGQFDCSNIYFVCRLHALSEEITVDGVEIAEARWIAIDDYLQDPDVAQLGKRVLQIALAAQPMPSVKIEGYVIPAEEYEIFAAGSRYKPSADKPG